MRACVWSQSVGETPIVCRTSGVEHRLPSAQKPLHQRSRAIDHNPQGQRPSSIIDHHLTPAQKSLHDRSNRVPSVPAHREGRDALAVDIVLWSSQLPADKNGIDARSNTINSEITRFYQNITTTQTQHNADNSTTTLNNNDSNRDLHSHCGSSFRPVVLRQHAEPIIARREDVVSALVEPNP